MIECVRSEPVDQFIDERGRVLDVWREDWDIFDDTPSMSYVSVTKPGVIRAWARHVRGQTDYFVVPHGQIQVGIYDGREDSPTQDELSVYYLGEGSMDILRIPSGCWHGFKVISERPATLINNITELYDEEDPDHEQLPHDTDEIPMDWSSSPHSSGMNQNWVD